MEIIKDSNKPVLIFQGGEGSYEKAMQEDVSAICELSKTLSDTGVYDCEAPGIYLYNFKDNKYYRFLNILNSLFSEIEKLNSKVDALEFKTGC